MRRDCFVKSLAASIAGLSSSAKALAPKMTLSELMAGRMPRSIYVNDPKGELFELINRRPPMANRILIFSTDDFGEYEELANYGGAEISTLSSRIADRF